MRVSGDKNDVGYLPLSDGCQVFLNGYLIENWTTVDDKKGFVTYYEENDQYRKITKTGKIDIYYKEVYFDYYKEHDEKMKKELLHNE